MPRIPIATSFVRSTACGPVTATTSSAATQSVAPSVAPVAAPAANTNFLHYGGSLSRKTGRLGAKPAAQAQFKSQKRLETIVRLENAAIPESACAAMLCISVPRLRTIKKSPEYLAARIRITHGIILDHDSQIETIKSQRKEMLTQLLPPALQILANELSQPAHTLAERKHQAAIAQDLLDREGTFAKISKTEIKPVDAFDFEKADTASASVINTLKSAVSQQRLSASASSTVDTHSAHTADAVAANDEFSRSHTLSAVDQQAALDALEESADPADLLEFMPLKSEKVN